jgi:NADH-quinone oxidoreductase subunit G
MVKIFIDETEIEIEEGTTVFNAAKKAEIEIPHFCYHPAFVPEGTCRMCLVEIEGVPKLELACSTVVRDGMKVMTKSEGVVEARKGVLEFLMADHPLDCPICDQAGDCKLQDYYEEYGLFESRFSEVKEKREKKRKLGKNLIHDQERCVLCRRCVRFTREISKTGELGVLERGVHAEISILDDAQVDNNYSGNLAQLCPVGAITDLDFRFQTRNWFLKSENSICPLCSRGCSISVDAHKGFTRFHLPKRVYRIRSRRNDKVNGRWICDIGRYGYSYIDKERIERISSGGSEKKEMDWEEGLQKLAAAIKAVHPLDRASQLVLVINSWLTNEELFLIKKMFIEDSDLRHLYFIDPPHEEGDGFLFTGERCPNKKGVLNVGIEPKPLALEALPEKAKLLLFFSPPLLDPSSLSAVKAAFDKAETGICFSSNNHEFCSYSDMVFPMAVIAEKGGSLINTDGLLQEFDPAIETRGDSWPAWKILVEIARKNEVDFKYFDQFSSPKTILKEMRKEIPNFGKNSD